jgi:hypothetical protein
MDTALATMSIWTTATMATTGLLRILATTNGLLQRTVASVERSSELSPLLSLQDTRTKLQLFERSTLTVTM